MDDQSIEITYNAFVAKQLHETDKLVQDILFGIPHWPAPSLVQGSLNAENTVECLTRLVDADRRTGSLCATLLYILCADHKACLKELSNISGTLPWPTVPFIALCRFKMDLSFNLISHAIQTIQTDWETAFIGSISFFALAEFLQHHFSDNELPLDIETPFFTHYVALLTILYEPLLLKGKRVDASFVRDLAQFDLTGPKLTTVENYGAVFEKAFVCCTSHPDIIARCHNMVESVADRESEYAMRIHKPFYKFGTPERIYDLVERLVCMTPLVDLEDTDNDCAICYDALANVVLDPCAHSFCSQCLQQMFRHSANTSCPACRADIDDVQKRTS